MKHKPTPHRRAAMLLLAAAALPLTPSFAQDTQTTTPTPTAPAPAQPPVVDVAPPPAVPTVAPIAIVPAAPVTPAPAVSTPPLSTSTAPASVPARRAAPARAARRAAPPVRAATARPAQAPVAATPAVQAPPETIAPAPAPAAQAATATPAAATPPAAAPTPARRPRGGSILPWLLAAIVAIGAIAFLLRRRRRAALVYDQTDEVPAAAPPVAAEPVIAPSAQGGRPWLELLMRPVRAGIDDKDAVVEFELIVDNQGPLPARDVRISTWMVAAGRENEMEGSLIERDEAGLPPVTIDPGDTKRVERAVALPTKGLDEDSVLPVVMAEARYRLPDGSEGRTAASFEVGVPMGDELAHFDIDHPSGLHEDVEARLHGEPERV
jgi:hypothetical protein